MPCIRLELDGPSRCGASRRAGSNWMVFRTRGHDVGRPECLARRAGALTRETVRPPLSRLKRASGDVWCRPRAVEAARASSIPAPAAHRPPRGPICRRPVRLRPEAARVIDQYVRRFRALAEEGAISPSWVRPGSAARCRGRLRTACGCLEHVVDALAPVATPCRAPAPSGAVAASLARCAPRQRGRGGRAEPAQGFSTQAPSQPREGSSRD